MKETVYFGTYTRRTSQGIYKADFDTETGQLSNLELFAAEPSPTYLAFDQHQHLYTVGSQDDKGGIAAYQTDGTVLNHVVEEGAPHCYVAVDEKRDLVYAANYHKGQVLVYKRQEDGSLLLSDMDQHSGQGPHENQASPHVHYTDLTPDHYLVTCDLGTDQVITYDLDQEGKLSKLYTYHSKPGAGSRHIIFHNHYKIAYLICELNSTIEVLIYDGVGEFERMQVISTLPEAYEGFNGTAAIHLSKDGKYLYASNRGHDSIAVYTILADGSLELLEIVPTHGQTPRDFDLTPDQKFLIVVHQDSDNVTVFKRNCDNGRLAELSNDFHVPEAVCIRFAP
ncbi:3-carboxymuconate cyclase [Streptococcus pneumoniae]|uniref:lactonase family protein n=1 Tax=Streptococcus pneumoniae TaxID=1313 RepID=UPI0007778256|nr:lactonase family protein [Streptococcus pneumoniae]KXW15041.1 6-phosphogluconolactonase [Streptococcus pneumoniae]NMH07366.1 beta-propeller fold lactonase family protein [Streptococcus pneumoniae]ODO33994.1 6-phosphogluconolactonase [Streptococcus pneumoniae]ODO53137.1 6-phosphogluconolactonase [Streptococcus pneumoniae]ODO54611.1 6-phosphogluconolactonase [Streptococcus pneumoniae]